MGFPRIKENELNSPRLVFHAKVNGFPVSLHVSDSDLDKMIEDGSFLPEAYKDGLVNAIVAELKTLGFDPAPSTPSSEGKSEPAWKKKDSSSQWECPEHGGKYVKSFPRGGNFCSAFELAKDDDETGPSWAKDTPNEFQGVWRWYCKHTSGR